jgi:O-antigen ligase
MLFTLLLFLLTLLALALLMSALVPMRLALWAGSALNVLQLHSISVLGVYPSLALLSWLSLWRAVLNSPLWRWPWMQAFALLVAIQCASLFWSPSPMLGVRHLIYLLPLPFVAFAMYRVSGEHPRLARDCLHLMLLGSAVEAVLVIAFRLLPSVEIAFLNHPVAGLFVSPNTLNALFDAHNNNVPDPAKAGGFFVNANVAAAYLGVSAIAAFYVGRAHGSRLLRVVAVIDWIAVLFTGSKAGLLCAVIVPAALMVASVLSTRRIDPRVLIAGALAVTCACILAMLPISTGLMENYRYEAFATLGSREEMWRVGMRLLQQHPFTGLGFGGWEQRFQVFAFASGVSVTAPPHNTFINLWLQSGLAAVFAGLLLMAAVYLAAIRAMRTPDFTTRQLGIAAVGAFSWCFIQGQGENFGIVGEIHMMPLLGALLGHLCRRCDSAEVEHEHGTVPLRGTVASPVVQAV